MLTLLPPYLAEEFPAKLAHRGGIVLIHAFIFPEWHEVKAIFKYVASPTPRYDRRHIQYPDFLAECALDRWAGNKYKPFLVSDEALMMLTDLSLLPNAFEILLKVTAMILIST